MANVPFMTSVGAAPLAETALPFHMGPYSPFLLNFQVGTNLATTQVTSTSDGAYLNYTIPSGFRAVASAIAAATNTSNASLTFQAKLGGSSTWVQIFNNSGLTQASVPLSIFTEFNGGTSSLIFEPGDVVAIKSNNGNPAFAFATVYLFSSSSPLRSPRQGSFSVGNNTVYSCPNGKNAIVAYFQNNTSAGVVVANTGSGTVSYCCVRVPNAQSATAINRVMTNTSAVLTQIVAGTSSTSHTANLGTMGATLAAGDSYILVVGSPATFTATAGTAASGGNTTLTGTFTGATGSALTLTQATSAGSTTQYTGTITGGGSNAFVGATFTIAGFTNAGNNGTFVCTASSTTVLTLSNSGGVNETHAGTATQNLFAGGSFLVAPNSSLNSGDIGVFQCVQSPSTTSLVLGNSNAAGFSNTGIALNISMVGFPVTSVANASAGTTVYTGVFPSGGSNALAGWNITMSGFTNSVNNGSFSISASTATSVTVNNASGTAETTYGAGLLTSYSGLYAWVNYIIESASF